MLPGQVSNSSKLVKSSSYQYILNLEFLTRPGFEIPDSYSAPEVEPKVVF